MGYALSEALASYGARITLISGPTSLYLKNENITLIPVTTADEMFEASVKHFALSNGAILAAAVADFKPAKADSRKIKSSQNGLLLNLVPTRDIAMHLGKMKTEKQFLAGFALETENEKENALKKLKNKNFDFIVLNSLRDKGAGFKTDTNKISILDKNNNLSNFELKSKTEVAEDIIDKLLEII